MLGSSVSNLDNRLGQWRSQSIGPLQGNFTPYQLANNAAVYSLSGDPSDATYIKDGSNRLQLVADRSGNSAVNALVCTGVASSNATTPNTAATDNGSGAIEVIFKIDADDYTTGTNNILLDNATGANGYRVNILNSIIRMGTAAASANSTAHGVTGLYWFKISSTGSGGTITFYKSPDGTTWTQISQTTDVARGASGLNTAVGSLIAGTLPFNGKIYYLSYAKSIGGTPSFVFNPAGVAKLAASFVSSTGETWTINTSGDTGARISGARDLVQLTQAKQPIWSTGSDGKNLATFDGVNDYMQAAPFSLSQPTMIYLTASAVTWTNGDFLCDGGILSRGAIGQGGSPATSPNIYLGGSVQNTANNGDMAVGVRCVITALVQNNPASLAINREASVSGTNIGAGAMNGFTLGAFGNATQGFGNITFSEALLRSIADDAATQARIVTYEMNAWAVPNFNLILDSSSQGINDSSGGVLFSPN